MASVKRTVAVLDGSPGLVPPSPLTGAGNGPGLLGGVDPFRLVPMIPGREG